MEFLRSFLRRYLAVKPVVASPNVGCFLGLRRVEVAAVFELVVMVGVMVVVVGMPVAVAVIVMVAVTLTVVVVVLVVVVVVAVGIRVGVVAMLALRSPPICMSFTMA